ncbi:hypothetical protein DKX38_001450 [Salix brachista]|uniref:Uncharacterized protein n=1 Tax=Salix brachista TaxID=2182728 RepID=A0A5N5P656_9ROSI|nr:hypothetical protein DKX38_001450 [Salix brachista]
MKTLSASSKLKREGESHDQHGQSFESKLIPAIGFIAFWCGGGTEPKVVVLLEGWMLGFKPLPVEVVQAVDPQLEILNKNLEAYYDSWDKFVKAWVVIKIQDPTCVYQWRCRPDLLRADDWMKKKTKNNENMEGIPKQ